DPDNHGPVGRSDLQHDSIFANCIAIATQTPARDMDQERFDRRGCWLSSGRSGLSAGSMECPRHQDRHYQPERFFHSRIVVCFCWNGRSAGGAVSQKSENTLETSCASNDHKNSFRGVLLLSGNLSWPQIQKSAEEIQECPEDHTAPSSCFCLW